MEDQYINQNEPQNLEAEIYVLGCIIIDNTSLSSMKGRLKAEDFYYPLHQNLYKCMEKLDLAKQAIDILTLQEMYEVLGFGRKEDIRKPIIDIINQVPNTAYIEAYLDIVQEKSIGRKLLKNISELEKNIKDNKLEYNKMLEMAENKIYEVIKARKSSDIIKIDKAAEEYYNDTLRRIGSKDTLTGLDTGYELVNKYTTGFQAGEFIIIAARPSVGKTAFALNLASNIAKKDQKHVAFFSLEMSVSQLMQRMYCMQAMLDADKLKKGFINEDEKIALGLAFNGFKDLNIYFDDGGSNTIGDIRAKCRQLKDQKKLDIVIIDYLQLISTSSRNNSNRQEGVSEISRNLKLLARELNIPVIALSQLSRSIETRDDKRPVLADLRESGSLEQDADIVMFLFKRSDLEPEDGSVLDDKQPKKVEQNENIRSLILKIEKNRQGSLGHIDFDFYGAQSRFVQSAVQQDIIYIKKQKSRKRN